MLGTLSTVCSVSSISLEALFYFKDISEVFNSTLSWQQLKTDSKRKGENSDEKKNRSDDSNNDNGISDDDRMWSRTC